MYYYCPHSTDEETEAQGGELGNLPKVSELVGGGFECGCLLSYTTFCFRIARVWFFGYF